MASECCSAETALAVSVSGCGADPDPDPDPNQPLTGEAGVGGSYIASAILASL
jgi:hypothetical protein